MFTQKEYELTFDTKDFPGLNRPQFDAMVVTEGNVFIKTLTDLKLEFVALSDVAALGPQCRFFNINGFPAALREIKQYDASDDSLYIRFDATVLVPVEALPADQNNSQE
jgi:hypothetical protein